MAEKPDLTPQTCLKSGKLFYFSFSFSFLGVIKFVKFSKKKKKILLTFLGTILHQFAKEKKGGGTKHNSPSNKVSQFICNAKVTQRVAPIVFFFKSRNLGTW